MINITIGLDGVPSQNNVVIGNQWENIDEYIKFSFPEDFAAYNKYIIAVHKNKNMTSTKVLPIIKDQLFISSSITCLSGKWYFYAMCRETVLDLENESFDIAAKQGEHVFIADGFIGVVNKNLIDKELIDNVELDTNIQIMYDDLLLLKQELQAKINTDINYTQMRNKPSINGVELVGNKTTSDLGIVIPEADTSDSVNVKQGKDKAGMLLGVDQEGYVETVDMLLKSIDKITCFKGAGATQYLDTGGVFAINLDNYIDANNISFYNNTYSRTLMVCYKKEWIANINFDKSNLLSIDNAQDIGMIVVSNGSSVINISYDTTNGAFKSVIKRINATSVDLDEKVDIAQGTNNYGSTFSVGQDGNLKAIPWNLVDIHDISLFKGEGNSRIEDAEYGYNLYLDKYVQTNRVSFYHTYDGFPSITIFFNDECVGGVDAEQNTLLNIKNYPEELSIYIDGSYNSLYIEYDKDGNLDYYCSSMKVDTTMLDDMFKPGDYWAGSIMYVDCNGCMYTSNLKIRPILELECFQNGGTSKTKVNDVKISITIDNLIDANDVRFFNNTDVDTLEFTFSRNYVEQMTFKKTQLLTITNENKSMLVISNGTDILYVSYNSNNEVTNVRSDRIATRGDVIPKLSIDQGVCYAGEALIIGDNGYITHVSSPWNKEWKQIFNHTVGASDVGIIDLTSQNMRVNQMQILVRWWRTTEATTNNHITIYYEDGLSSRFNGFPAGMSSKDNCRMLLEYDNTKGYTILRCSYSGEDDYDGFYETKTYTGSCIINHKGLIANRIVFEAEDGKCFVRGLNVEIYGRYM